MESTNIVIVKEEIPRVPYQEAMEMSGYVQGYMDSAQQNSVTSFDAKFVDAIGVLCQFVKENHLMPYDICNVELKDCTGCKWETYSRNIAPCSECIRSEDLVDQYEAKETK